MLQNARADLTVDLDAAMAIATSANDQEAMLCYPALKAILGTATPSVNQIRGFISVYEKLRVTRKGFGSGVPVGLKIACAPLLMDEAQFLIKLGVLTGAAVGSGGATLPLMIP